MEDNSRKTLLTGSIINAALTFISRILGMFRDMATAMLFGVSAGGVFDVFVLAFRLPNLFRRLFGEGAISISFQPAFCRQWHKNQSSAWELLTAMVTALSAIMGIVTLIGAIICSIAIFCRPNATQLLPGLTLVMLPYLFLISQTAIFASALQGLRSFTAPAAAPVIMNVLWLWAVLEIAPGIKSPENQAYLLATVISISSVLQLLLQIGVLRKHGYKFQRCLFSRIAPYWRRSTAGWITMVLGLSAVQVCVVTDSIVSWPCCPTGTVSAVFLAERLFEFPLGLIGISVATAVYPLLNQHASEKNYPAVESDMNQAIGLALFWSLPATAGLILLATPLCQILFEHGATTAEDCKRIGTILAIYSSGVWAYCLLPILTRGFYCLQYQRQAAGAALITMIANIIINLILILFLPSQTLQFGLAGSTVLSISGLALYLGIAFYRLRKSTCCEFSDEEKTPSNNEPLQLRKHLVTERFIQYIGATIIMFAAGTGMMNIIPDEPTLTTRLIRVSVVFTTCIVVYLSVTFIFSSGKNSTSIVKTND